MKPTFASTDLLESLGYGYFELDLRGYLIYGNKYFLEALGYTADELRGKHFRRYIRRDQVSLIFSIFEMIYRTGMVEKNLLLDFVRKDGSSHPSEGSYAVMRDENNNPIGYRGILLDITARKQQETMLIEQKKKAERELEIAREIQSSFLVQNYPQPEGWEIATLIRPARQVSGDFYDVFPIATSRQIALVMADVCDKGVGAAMYMAIFRSLLRAFSDQQYIIRWSGVPTSKAKAEPAESTTLTFRKDSILASGAPSLKNAIELTNNYIATQHSDSNMFATVFFGLLDPSDGNLVYINAGHEAPLLLSNGTVKSHLEPTGPAVGMLPNMEFKIESVKLSPGDSLLLYTDGVTDALNANHNRFSEERLIAAATYPSTSAQSQLQSIVSAVNTHIAGREQYDDITLLAVQRKR